MGTDTEEDGTFTGTDLRKGLGRGRKREGSDA